ncbi:hypothetical protein [Clostridium thailandense]|uniref:hypothetical protein n=1 Tax=Clostridium thailandense TaxID=2794346 RepID=UPI003989C785
MSESKEGLKDFSKKLLNPYSPVVTLLAGGFISSYVNIVKVSLPYILYALELWFVSACAYQIYSNGMENMKKIIGKHKDEILKLEKSVHEKEIQIKTNVGLIEARYGEFSEYVKKTKYKTLSKKIVNKFSYIDAVQIYNYTIGTKTNTEHIEIKIKYDTGAEYEGININVIKQQYYKIEKKVYLDFLEIQKMYGNIQVSNLYEDEKIQQLFIEKSFLLLDYLSEENNPINQRVFILVAEMINDIDLESELGQLIEDEIDDCVRSGILGSILSNRDYMYYYKKNKMEKLGRTYFSFNDIMDGENKIITIVINSNSINMKDREKLINEVIAYYEEIYSKLFK